MRESLYEYKVVTRLVFSIPAVDIEKELNTFGVDGWDLVHAERGSGRAVIFFFKRRVEINSARHFEMKDKRLWATAEKRQDA